MCFVLLEGTMSHSLLDHLESSEDSDPTELMILKIDLSIPWSYNSHIRKPSVLSPLRSNEVDLVPLACKDVQSIAVVTDQGQ